MAHGPLLLPPPSTDPHVEDKAEQRQEDDVVDYGVHNDAATSSCQIEAGEHVEIMQEDELRCRNGGIGGGRRVDRHHWSQRNKVHYIAKNDSLASFLIHRV